MFNEQSAIKGIEKTVDFYNHMQRRERDRVVFTDPGSGENIASELPPQFLNQDKKLQEGYGFLQKFGHLVNLEVILARHGDEDEAALGDQQFGFEERVRASDIFLLEGLGYTNQTEAMMSELSRSGQAEGDIEKWIGKSLYRLCEAQALQNSGVAVGFFDIDNSPDEYNIRQSLIEVSELYNSIDSFEGDKVSKVKLKWIHTLSVEILREWFMVGNVGQAIAIRCQQDPKLHNKLLEGKLKVILTAGESHGDLVRKLRLYGIKVDASRPEQKESDDFQNTMFPKWVEQGYISNDDLERLATE